MSLATSAKLSSYKQEILRSLKYSIGSSSTEQVPHMQLIKRDFSRREWLMIIAIVMMVEYWILSLSYEFRGSSTVVNFVSFAAAITSLLLAVIAIIFSFLQSDAQQNATTAMIGQIDSLRSVATSLDVSGSNIATQASEIGNAADQLQQLSLAVRDSYQKIVDLEDHLSGIRGTQEAMSAAVAGLSAKKVEESNLPQAADASPYSKVYKLFRATSFEADFLGYCLSLYIGLDAALRPPLLTALDSMFIEPLTIARKYKSSDRALEAMFAYLGVARTEQIILDNWTINPSVENEIKSAAQETEESLDVDWMKEAFKKAKEAAQSIAASA